MGISAYTRNEISHPSSLSSILAHKRETGHSISFDDFSVLASGRSEFDTLIRESLLIAKNKSLSQCKHKVISSHLIWIFFSSLFSLTLIPVLKPRLFFSLFLISIFVIV